jgi:translation initiation factor eIF-2B subunit epsilon
VFVLDAETSECVHYEPVMGYPPTTVTQIPREILVEHPEVEIRNDLIDCSIDVCAVEVISFCRLMFSWSLVNTLKVPSLFQDNFDYQDIRRDFVHGILTSDLLMKNIYCYVAKEGYAARVKDTKSYDSIRYICSTERRVSNSYLLHIFVSVKISFRGGRSH